MRNNCHFAARSLLIIAACFLPLAGRAAPDSGAISPSLNSPECIRVPEARAEQEGDEQLAVGRGGDFCAYPLRMMAFHRVVNDHLGGPPILVAYDPDSGAGRVFDPVLEGKPYTFDAAPPVRGLAALKDRETGSTWSLLSGKALSGPLAGKQLAPIPALIVTWGRWKTLHPDSWVLAEDARLSPHYTARVTAAACPLPPGVADALGEKPDARLRPDRLVLGISADGGPLAAALTDANGKYGARASVTPVKIGGKTAVLLTDPGARSAAVYWSEIPARRLSFRVAVADGTAPRWKDKETGSIWNLEGRCVEGPLKGQALAAADFVRVRWYAWSSAHPGTVLLRVRSGGGADRS